MPPKPSDTDDEKPKRPRHNFNMSPELKERLLAARSASGSSMNAEIHARLEATFDEPTLRLAATIWPMLQKLKPADREKFAEMITAMAKGRS